MTEKQQSLMHALIAEGVTPGEAKRLYHSCMVERQHADEHAKAHALDTLELSAEAVATFCAHMLDCGGVVDPHMPVAGNQSLFDLWMQAVHDRDWNTIRHLMPGLVKAWMKAQGQVRPNYLRGAPTGRVPNHFPAAAETNQP